MNYNNNTQTTDKRHRSYTKNILYTKKCDLLNLETVCQRLVIWVHTSDKICKVTLFPGESTNLVGQQRQNIGPKNNFFSDVISSRTEESP